MTDIIAPETQVFRSYVDVTLIEAAASDSMVVAAARVSTVGDSEIIFGEDVDAARAGLINFLMKNRHGSPFEHNVFIFKVTAPIFVWREHMRHRIGFSYNEESGRYKQLDPVFYIPDSKRPLVQTGKTGHYEFHEGDASQRMMVQETIIRSSSDAYANYVMLLKHGIAKEVARMVLPVNVYSTAYVTMNARSMMNFLSLRTKNPDATYPSYPMREIEMVAQVYEAFFESRMPLTYEAFRNNGRVAP